MEINLINPCLLALCGIVAWLIYKMYDFIENRIELIKNRKNDFFRQKVKRVKRAGINYYLDLMRTHPHALAEKLSRIQTRQLIENGQLETTYYKLIGG